MINNLKQKAPIQVSLTGEFHQTFMEEIPIEKKSNPTIFFKMQKAKEYLFTYSEARIMLAKPKNIIRNENYRLVFLMDRDAKMLKKILVNEF